MYIHTCVCVCVCAYHVDLKYLYKHILLFTNRFMKKKNLQAIIVVQIMK